MENLLDKLQQERELTQRKLLFVEDNDFTARLQNLKEIYEEMELVAASSYINLNPTEEEPLNPNPHILTSDFYSQYLLILLISHEMNDARFLWKRIDSNTKNTSQELRNVWQIGKMLWQRYKRNYAGAYQVIDEKNNTWSNGIGPLIALLRKVTREETTRLVSSAYKSISFSDAAQALGFFGSNQDELLRYCTQLDWTISKADEKIYPKPIKQHLSRHTDLNQLKQLSQYVLHLEQATTHKL